MNTKEVSNIIYTYGNNLKSSQRRELVGILMDLSEDTKKFKLVKDLLTEAYNKGKEDANFKL